MRILTISNVDQSGGAERVAWNLFQGYRAQGHESWLAVGFKRGDDPDVFLIPNDQLRLRGWRGFWLKLAKRISAHQHRLRGLPRLSQFARELAEPIRARDRRRGYEDFAFPGTAHLLSLSPAPPQILHAHNLHGGYFDLRHLPTLSQQVPLVMTLHDGWLLSGHCAHSFECPRWQTGCGACPDLTIYPAIQHDGTAYNWARKRDLYARSRLYISTPSQWLMDKVQQSMLMAGAVETRIIPYGVDLSIFKPADQSAARRALNLPLDAHILLFSAASIRQNPFKDYLTMRQAVERVAASMDNQQVIFLALGEDAPSEHLSATTQIRFIPYQADLRQIALFYQASDLYIHAAKADTFPNAVLEALACGVPVVGSTVGGIPEQIYPFDESPRPTGILAQSGDSGAMAQGIVHLLHHPDLRRQMGESAAQDAQRRYDLNRQIGDYLEWYRTILADFYNIIPKQKIPNA